MPEKTVTPDGLLPGDKILRIDGDDHALYYNIVLKVGESGFGPGFLPVETQRSYFPLLKETEVVVSRPETAKEKDETHDRLRSTFKDWYGQGREYSRGAQLLIKVLYVLRHGKEPDDEALARYTVEVAGGGGLSEQQREAILIAIGHALALADPEDRDCAVGSIHDDGTNNRRIREAVGPYVHSWIIEPLLAALGETTIEDHACNGREVLKAQAYLELRAAGARR